MNRTSIFAAVRQPKSAAVAGLVFGTILGGVIVLFHDASPVLVADAGTWADDEARRESVSRALNLIPFAGIAFLWFVAVIRAQLGSREDRFFETVFLGSGLLFVAMLFAAAAVLKGALALTEAGVGLPSETLAFSWALATALLGSFGARMAAVFVISVATMGVRTGTIPRWLAFPGYLTGVMLLLTPPLPSLAQFLLPLWIVALSLFILFRRTPVVADVYP